MCSTKAYAIKGADQQASPASINGRPVLQPTASSWNRIRATLGRQNSFEKAPLQPNKSGIPLDKMKVARASRSDCDASDASMFKSASLPPVKSKNAKETSRGAVGSTNGGGSSELSSGIEASLTYSSSLIVESPGSIAAVRREHVALQQAQRKLRIAHYGRSKSAKFSDDANLASMLGVRVAAATNTSGSGDEFGPRRCSFITPNSDSIYVTYHDEEWGVPVHDDRMLFELLVLSSAQVGSDWASILKRRQSYRSAFAGFDPEMVAGTSDRKMQSITAEHGIEISRVRGVVDNANRILEIREEFGSFANYIWGFVNHKAISTNYKFSYKIPVKTSKSETISKDMVRRGFRFVGPTAIHSFMQAAGLTNDHLVTCHRHLQCSVT